MVSVSTSHTVGPGFASQPGQTKDHHKNGTNCLPALAMQQVFYLLLYGLRCRKSTTMDYSINQPVISDSLWPWCVGLSGRDAPPTPRSSPPFAAVTPRFGPFSASVRPPFHSACYRAAGFLCHASLAHQLSNLKWTFLVIHFPTRCIFVIVSLDDACVART